MEETSVQSPTIDEKSIEEKKASLLKRKKSFEFKFFFVKIFLFLLLTYPVGKYIYDTYIYTPPPVVPEPKIVNGNGNGNQNVTQKTFTNQDLMLALFYPSNAEITEVTKTSDNSIVKMSILYSGDKKTGDPALTEKDIYNGYYIRITRFISQKQDINGIIQSKLSGMKQKCLESSFVSEISSVKLDTVNGKTFSITNCDGNWKITYIPRFYSYYEIEQYMRGDFGYMERYTNETDDIVKTIKFYADEPPPFEEFETFYDQQYRYSLDHRHYNSICCDVPSPAYPAFSKRLVIADPSSIIDGNNFNGIGIYTAGYSNFDEFVDNEKKTLRDEYVVINGVEPTTEETTFNIQDKRAVRLKGYSWKGNDLIYIDNTEKSGFVIAISVVNKSGDGFEPKLQEMLDRMVFDILPQ